MSLFKVMDNFLKNCLERIEEFKADILVFFTTSCATVKVTTSGQICETLVCTAYCNTYCIMGQPYCNILQYAFYRIVSSLDSDHIQAWYFKRRAGFRTVGTCSYVAAVLLYF